MGDKNQDGYITKEELTAVFAELDSSVGEKELDQILAVADLNKDGHIDYKEFVGWLFGKKAGREGTSTAVVRRELASDAVDWESVNAKLPYERTPEARVPRKELFNQFDEPN